MLIREYRPEDEASLLRVWNDALIRDQITPTRWHARVLSDPNFTPDGCLIAEVDGQVAGFLLSLIRREPYGSDGLQPEQAWITAFAVDPRWQGRGVGSNLLTTAEDRLHRLGRKVVTLGPYLPNYFTPGADIAAYRDGVEFLLRRGFTVLYHPLDMEVTRQDVRLPDWVPTLRAQLAQGGIVIRAAREDAAAPLLAFVGQHFSPSWRAGAEAKLRARLTDPAAPTSTQVAVSPRGIIGYAQHQGEEFGPLGVHPEMRGRGIGKLLVAATLTEMLDRGCPLVYIAWTYDEAARLYAQFGFREARRFAILQKDL